MPHLVLIDGPNYVFRAFHAIQRQLTNSKGLPTNAIFGYVQMLRSVLEDLQPTHAAVAFDPKDGSFRNRIYPPYKAHRPPMPEELARQWPWVFEVTHAFNLPLLRQEDYEADDLIATLALRAAAKGWDVTIVSTDKDLMQLVGEHIRLLDTMRGKKYGAQEVREKWGVNPARIRDLLALAGDSSDNIPGVPGIGPKTAAQLLSEYGDLEGVLRHAPDIKQTKRRENLLQHAEDARLSYRLVGLETDAPVGVELDDLALRKPDRRRLAKLFKELEFRRFLAEFSDDADAAATAGEKGAASSTPAAEAGGSAQQPPVGPRTDHIIQDKASLDRLVERLARAEWIALDTETTSLTPHDAELVGISFAVQPGEAYYIPLAHRSADAEGNPPRQLARALVLDTLKPLLENEAIKKCGHNLKYDIQVLQRAGITLAGIAADSMLLAYCLYPGKYTPSLDNVALDYLGYRCTSYTDIAGKGAKRKRIGFDAIPLDRAAPYACEDADIALRLTQYLRALLRAESRLERHDKIELPLSLVLAEMEWHGVRIDTDRLATLSQEFGRRIRELEGRIHAAAGIEFNIHSPRQLGEVLFERLGLPGGKKTKSGQWQTSQGVLETLADQHDVPRLILEVRALSKLKSTYTDALQKLVHPETGRVHTSYNQAITSTGRLSSSDPNLQNIPIRSKEGQKIRKAFVAEPGHVLVAGDYSQIELRLMAHFSKDEALLQAFRNGEDIHAATAAAIHGVPLDQVSGEMRRHAKIINFGILYGMSAFGLAKQLNIGRKQAQAFIDAYFDQHRQVRAFIKQTLERARAQGFVETLLGHRVHVPGIRSRNAMQRVNAERTAINAPLQGSAADIIKVAMIDLHRRLQEEAPDARLILQVHDELVVEAPEGRADQVCAIMRETMQAAVKLDVPLVVDIGQGSSWLDAHRL